MESHGKKWGCHLTRRRMTGKDKGVIPKIRIYEYLRKRARVVI